jgi:hypothetical protein
MGEAASADADYAKKLKENFEKVIVILARTSEDAINTEYTNVWT